MYKLRNINPKYIDKTKITHRQHIDNTLTTHRQHIDKPQKKTQKIHRKDIDKTQRRRRQEINKTQTFKRKSLRLFRFKISQSVPFLIKNQQNLPKICKKGTNCEILNLNNERLGRLKVHVIKQKSLTDGGNPTKKINF